MIDLHSHILHGLDDGARTLEESIEMARLAAADGIRVLAATPHSPASTASVHYSAHLVQEGAARLRAALSQAAIALEIITGTEITYVADIPGKLERGALLTYSGSRALLLEPPFSGLPSGLELLLFNLQIAGYRVILAHPERLPDVQSDPNRLIPLIEHGMLIQVTGQALSGGQGAHLRSVAETLLLHGMVHILASDAHGISPRRQPLLSPARDHAAALIGAEAALTLVDTTPRAVLDGRQVHRPAPRAVGRRRR